eukprot:Plantae.Rhodophyta-Purpureofilum_apyrenoidigerum.ctg7784.p1 GENE.Plantae.Rhodophyta-Purpureofilum_apyrenoidigerum.ctg7784~~Plantae.Rhodophyta-Purpureofilum_apyrenoidigerum.ctg7784.p1  ORF type:complete len:347 (-),score=65.76 Plantae.Rhodophyta-Purpureofilum_apyrenoidigerum.ctg7784:1058-2098(-)
MRGAVSVLRRSLAMAASGEKLSIVVLGGEGDKSLEPLKTLPSGAEVIGVGASADAFDANVLSKARCVFCTASGNPASTLPAIYSKLSSVEWVHSQLAGVDKLMFPEFIADEDVLLTNARGVYNRPLVEWSIFAMMFFAKDLPRLRRNQFNRKWDAYSVQEIHNKVLGVVGYGDIGKDCARKAKEAFGMKVIALRRRPKLSGDDGIADEVYGQDQLHEMLGNCDYVLCAAPLTPETKHMFDRDAFKAMKKTGVYINIGRGPVCQEKALVGALQEGHIRGAALDVFEKEPLSSDSELWGFENLLLSPHNADLTETCRTEATEHFVQQVKAKLEGKSIENCACDKKAGY